MYLIIILFLLLASAYDIKYKIIPNYISLLILLVGFLFGKIYFSGILVAVFILAICLIYDEKYKGGGDIKLIASIGVLIGFYKVAYVYAIAEILVVIFRSIYKKVKKQEIIEISYAPFIFIGMIIL